MDRTHKKYLTLPRIRAAHLSMGLQKKIFFWRYSHESVHAHLLSARRMDHLFVEGPTGETTPHVSRTFKVVCGVSHNSAYNPVGLRRNLVFSLWGFNNAASSYFFIKISVWSLIE